MSKCAEAPPPGEVFGGFLEGPQSGKMLGGDKQTLRIGGWVLSNDPAAQVQVIVSGPGVRTQVGLELLRADVVARLGAAPAQNRCGFLVEVEAVSPLELHVQVDGQDYPWQSIKLLPVDPVWGGRMVSTWEAYCQDRLGEIGPEEAERLESLDARFVETMLFKSPKIFRDLDGARRSGCFSNAELGHLSGFLRDLAAVDLCGRLVGGALELGECRLDNPFGAGHAICRESFASINTLSLRFVAPSGEVFFLLQQVTCADAVYFPCRGTVLLRQHVTVAAIAQAVHHLCSRFSRYLQYSRQRSAHRFLGLLASQGRPYHFYYDVAPAMHGLARQGLLERLPAIVMAHGGDYYSFKALYGLDCEESVRIWPDIDADTLAAAGFWILAGLPFSQGNRLLIEDFDRSLLAHALACVDAGTAAEVEAARACFPLLWFGVTGQKRAWLEQAEAAAAIIGELARAFPGLGVVFDGWTSPLQPSEMDGVESERDAKVVGEILPRLPAGVRTFSVVGANSIRKLAFAQAVDVFIANHATGSMHVGRFARKPGVGHLNTQMPLDLHIHHDTVRVPPEQVRDVPDPANPRIDYTSYSIDWRDVYALLRRLLEERNLACLRLAPPPA